MKVVNVSDVATITMGQAPLGSDCNKEGIGTVFVKAGEFGDRHPDIVEWTTKPQKMAKAGDTLVCVVGATAGKVNQAIDCAIGRSAAAVTGDPKKIDQDYLYRFFETNVQKLRRVSQGLAQGVITREMLKSLEIPLPPLPEQRRIAGILDEADALRRLRRQSLSRLSDLGQAIFCEMFGDVRINDRNWDDGVTLQECAEVVSGITKGRKLNGQSTRAIPYMTVATVQDGYLNLDNVKSIEATDREIERYRLLPFDILLTEGGDPDKLGRGAMWLGQLPKCIHQNHVFRVRVRDNRITPTFATWLIGSSRGKSYFFRAAKQTTGIASINSTQLKMFPLILPPIELQNQFTEHLNLLDMKGKSVDAAIEQTDSLFASLQYRAFRGEL